MECFKCSTTMTTANLVADINCTPPYVFKKKGFFDSMKRSSVSCYVCPNCGYIELRANEPGQLVER